MRPHELRPVMLLMQLGAIDFLGESCAKNVKPYVTRCQPDSAPRRQLAIRVKLVSLRAQLAAKRAANTKPSPENPRTMTKKIQTVLIYGYGVMGQGVARTFAKAGFDTIIRSSRAAELKDLPAGVRAVAKLPEMPPDLVLELVPEEVKTKQAVYLEVEAAYPGADVIIATGTSGLDLVELAKPLKHPERFVGLHYFMPADQALVVEVMAGPSTPAALVDLCTEVLRRTGKEPVVLYKPIVGFLVNRLQHAILHEAYYLIEAGVASAADIDHAARRMLAPQWQVEELASSRPRI